MRDPKRRWCLRRALLRDLKMPESRDGSSPCCAELILLVAIEETEMRCILGGNKERYRILEPKLVAYKSKVV